MAHATAGIFVTALGLCLGCGGTGSVGNSNDGGADSGPNGQDGGQDSSSSEAGKHEGGKHDGGMRDGGSDGAELGDSAVPSDSGADATEGGLLPTEWTIVSTPLDGGVGLYGVGGYTTLDVWAVGGGAGSPADIFWGGTSWVNLGLVTSTSALLSVSSQGADDSWTVAGSTVFNWDGTGWHTLALEASSTPLSSVYAVAPGRAFAVGNAGTVLDCDRSTTVCTTASAGSKDLTSVWGLDTSHAWAVGKGGAIYGYDGVSWSSQTGSGTADLYAVQGSDIIDLWAVGDVIEHSDGSGTWTKEKLTPTGTLHGVWAAAPDQAWAVGQGGIILAWDGKKWKSTTSPTTSDLYAIWGWNVHDIWAVGANNTILRRQK